MSLVTLAEPSPRPSAGRQRKRLTALDVLRASAAAAVVMIHVSAAVLLNTPRNSLGFQVAGLVNQFARFAVPAFVLITGVGLFYNYGHRPHFSWKQYLLRRASSLGLPYLFWSIVYFFFFRWVEQDFTQLAPRLVTALATASAVYTFYYFLIIVPFYLLFPLLRPLARTRWMGVAALAAIAGNAFVVWFSFPYPKIPLGPVLSRLYVYPSHTPLWWMGPFFLGAWLASRWDVAVPWLRRHWASLSVLAGILLVWVLQEFWAYVQIGKLAYVATNFRPSAYTYGLVIMLATIGFGAVLTERPGWITRGILSFSKYSFGVFLIHPLVMHGIKKALSLLPVGALVYFVLYLGLVLAASYLLARIIAMIPGGGLLIGVRTGR